jgi:hypothetical protein
MQRLLPGWFPVLGHYPAKCAKKLFATRQKTGAGQIGRADRAIAAAACIERRILNVWLIDIVGFEQILMRHITSGGIASHLDFNQSADDWL